MIAALDRLGDNRLPRRKLWLSKKDKERKRWARAQIDAAFNDFVRLKPSPFDDMNQKTKADRLLGRMTAIAEATGTRYERDMVEDILGQYRQRGVDPDALAVTNGMNELAAEWNAHWRDQT